MAEKKIGFLKYVIIGQRRQDCSGCAFRRRETHRRMNSPGSLWKLWRIKLSTTVRYFRRRFLPYWSYLAVAYYLVSGKSWNFRGNRNDASHLTPYSRRPEAKMKCLHLVGYQRPLGASSDIRISFIFISKQALYLVMVNIKRGRFLAHFETFRVIISTFSD